MIVRFVGPRARPGPRPRPPLHIGSILANSSSSSMEGQDAAHVATKAFPGPALSCHFTVMNFMIYDRRNWILLTFQQFHLSVLPSAPPIAFAFWLPTTLWPFFAPLLFGLALNWTRVVRNGKESRAPLRGIPARQLLPGKLILPSVVSSEYLLGEKINTINLLFVS